MATMRTVQVLLDDYAPNTDITATIDYVEVFSGILDPKNPMFTFEVPMDFDGVKKLAITVNNGIVKTDRVRANYTLMPNPIFTEAERDILYTPDTPENRILKRPILKAKANPQFTSAQLAVLDDPDSTVEEIDVILKAAHVCGAISTGPNGYVGVNDSNNTFLNVLIDNIPQPVPPAPGSEDWAHMVYQGSTLVADINIKFGITEDTSIVVR